MGETPSPPLQSLAIESADTEDSHTKDGEYSLAEDLHQETGMFAELGRISHNFDAKEMENELTFLSFSTIPNITPSTLDENYQISTHRNSLLVDLELPTNVKDQPEDTTTNNWSLFLFIIECLTANGLFDHSFYNSLPTFQPHQNVSLDIEQSEAIDRVFKRYGQLEGFEGFAGIISNFFNLLELKLLPFPLNSGSPSSSSVQMDQCSRLCMEVIRKMARLHLQFASFSLSKADREIEEEDGDQLFGVSLLHLHRALSRYISIRTSCFRQIAETCLLVPPSQQIVELQLLPQMETLCDHIDVINRNLTPFLLPLTSTATVISVPKISDHTLRSWWLSSMMTQFVSSHETTQQLSLQLRSLFVPIIEASAPSLSSSLLSPELDGMLQLVSSSARQMIDICEQLRTALVSLSSEPRPPLAQHSDSRNSPTKSSKEDTEPHLSLALGGWREKMRSERIRDQTEWVEFEIAASAQSVTVRKKESEQEDEEDEGYIPSVHIPSLEMMNSFASLLLFPGGNGEEDLPPITKVAVPPRSSLSPISNSQQKGKSDVDFRSFSAELQQQLSHCSRRVVDDFSGE